MVSFNNQEGILCFIGYQSFVHCRSKYWFSATVMWGVFTRCGIYETEEIWLTNAVQLGFVLGALAIAIFNISDIFPLTRLISFSCLLAALANVLLIWTSDGNLILFLRCLTGAALAGVYPPCVKLIATWFKRGRGLAMGVIIGAFDCWFGSPHLFRAFASGAKLVARFDTQFGHDMPCRSDIFASCKEAICFAKTVFDPTKSQILRNRPSLW